MPGRMYGIVRYKWGHTNVSSNNKLKPCSRGVVQSAVQYKNNGKDGVIGLAKYVYELTLKVCITYIISSIFDKCPDRVLTSITAKP